MEPQVYNPGTVTSLDAIAQQLATAKEPEDLFGPLTGTPTDQLTEARRQYRKMVRVTHEDLYPDGPSRDIARTATATLTDLYARCKIKIIAGTYGHKPIGTVASRTETYLLQRIIATGDVSTVYSALGPNGLVLVKVSLSASVNLFLEHEVSALGALRKSAIPSVQALLPEVRTAFRVKQSGGARHVTVFAYDPEYRPLQDIRAQFPAGLDPRHGVWIFKRLVSVLAATHDCGLVHGAVLPQHVLIRPSDHGLLLVDWGFAVPTGAPLQALSAAFKAWYPPEVEARRPVDARTDLFMAAQVLAYLMGGPWDPPLVLSDQLPERLRRVVRPCLLRNQAFRPDDGWKLYDAFDEAARRVYGKPEFVQLDTAAKGA